MYNPPNLTFPFGAYICVADVDTGTGQVKVRRFIAVDDCGVRINPMIVEGQVHGGLADGIGMALMELIAFDEDGNCLYPSGSRAMSDPEVVNSLRCSSLFAETADVEINALAVFLPDFNPLPPGPSSSRRAIS